MKKPENKRNKNKLNFRQQLFADWYIKLMHITNAAIKAGYSKKTAYAIGSKLLKKVEIKLYIQKRKKELEDLIGFSKATQIIDLLEIKKRSMQAEPVMEWDRDEKKYVQVTEENEHGEEVGVYTFDSIGANRALENINKMMGYNEPEQVEDVTPLANKKPAIVVINKTYVNKEPDKPTS